ncbi:DUF4852 domain-containing protein [Pandoraea apista]|uniref:DUF4852 domain-containing protein n=1 Tax=Pandoraea apista TaxID=93218 RepID=A0A0G4JCU5_9BURK|nr:DUF4852 domain-containing protein [Pandoraea apista]AVF38507.1 DUF4852 domain-containing protein [Pandoraea apista]PTE00697.1 DUF4852 domain-containing protein [Pandoraea apista]RRJ33259.1 DUF4852 domain-containing protein [Pandoraea apista]RRJ80394.1 DUF4852 domain-containing protein [Pandoraea apista]RRW93557.1 DUF4852 domain-containing protein [Pandoraea apista]
MNTYMLAFQRSVGNLLLTTAIAASALGLSACGDKSPSGKPAAEAGPAAPNLADATSPRAVAQAQQQAAQSALPKGDPATPASNYVEYNSGNQLMFAYLALSDMPIDYDQIANRMSRDYAAANDEFRKRDLLAALKPKIDQAVAQAKAQRYFRITVSNPVQKYDFEKKSFPLDSSLWESGSYRYFYDNGEYRLSFSDGDRFRYLSVNNEEAARNIEAMRARGNPPTLVVYGYTQASDMSNKAVKAQIVKVALVDRQGNVLAEQQ